MKTIIYTLILVVVFIFGLVTLIQRAYEIGYNDGVIDAIIWSTQHNQNDVEYI